MLISEAIIPEKSHVGRFMEPVGIDKDNNIVPGQSETFSYSRTFNFYVFFMQGDDD